ncbi:unnamed protein product [Gongylonema pulchrum]|uniref:MFS domain-containing protein n=1 Tax=Gongylonema pulchrum TaxID=637853 RepID=A0A183DUX6_9BILA|nr:unnamed protein product [Gongylonema pulchrum]
MTVKSNFFFVFLQHNAANWFSLVYIICTIPVGFFSMWMGSSFGLRLSILIAAWANAIAALAYPFIMFLPPKVSGSWFAVDQRAVATTIGIMANPLGVLTANLVAPQLVKSPDEVLRMNILTAVPAVVACIAATFFVTRSEPPTPPSRSAAQPQTPFIPGSLRIFSTSLKSTFLTTQQLLCTRGYSNGVAGACAALMITGGICGSAASSIYVDRTKSHKITIKVCMSAAVVFGISFLVVTGLAAYPIGLELASECTFPVSETTSTGFVVLSGQVFLFFSVIFQNKALFSNCIAEKSNYDKHNQITIIKIQSIIFVLLMNVTTKPLSKEYKKIEVMSIIATFLAVILVFFFNPKYKRLEMEKSSSGTSSTKPLRSAKDNSELPLTDLRPVKDEALQPLATTHPSNS